MNKLQYTVLLGIVLLPLMLASQPSPVWPAAPEAAKFDCTQCQVYTTNAGKICIHKGEAGATLHPANAAEFSKDTCNQHCNPYPTGICITKGLLGATLPPK